MQNQSEFVTVILILAATTFFLSRTKYMSSEQPQVVQEDTTPQQQEPKKPELASRVASSGLRLPIPLPNLEDLVKAQGKPGGGRIGRPVEPPIDS